MPRRTTIPRPGDRRRIDPPSAPRTPDRRPIDTVVVAVPARDEAANVRACLRSIDRAAAIAQHVDVVAVVAADSCRDATAEVASATLTTAMRTIVVEGAWRSPGAARAAAAAAGLASTTGASAWLANTDADCVVGSDWLTAQLAHAAAGHDAVAGVMRLDPRAPARLRAEFATAYVVAGDRHRHVHAANLGVRATAYFDVGGWSPHAIVGEDHNLWRRLRVAGHATLQPADVVVTTSARLHGRVIGGFASTLARLDARATGERTA